MISFFEIVCFYLINFVFLVQMKPKIDIDPGAGFCSGVQRAINMAEAQLNRHGTLICLGDIIHNNEVIYRLKSKGLQIVSHCQIAEQSGKTMILRSHGEPPSTYRIADNYGVEIIDATCPIVSLLQRKISEASMLMEKVDGQVILYGDMNHAEVIGLKGYAKGVFIIVRDKKDLEKINTSKPTVFFSQTTKYESDYKAIVKAFKKKREADKSVSSSLQVVDSLCKCIAKRNVQLKMFLKDKDILIFVSGQKSSNGKYLFNIGKKQLKRSYSIEKLEDIQQIWFKNAKRIAISGATSTPTWLLEKTQQYIIEMV